VLRVKDECKDFKQQIVRCGDRWKGFLVGLSEKSLWAMDLPDTATRFATAKDLAQKVSWKKLVDLPGEVAQQEDMDEDEDFPRRLLAAGPASNQVVVFAPQRGSWKPWMLITISGFPETADTRVIELTSTASVPLETRKDASHDGFCDIVCSTDVKTLTSVIRVDGQRSGYLFFNEQGSVYRLRDEEVMLAQDAWEPLCLIAGPEQRVVTFKFSEDDSAGRCCLYSVLARFEYFQKLLDNWKEGKSSEVTLGDTDAKTFDHFLAYAHSGKLEGQLELVTLFNLLQLGNKYIIQHLVMTCVVQILGILDDEIRMKEQQPALLAELLIFADAATACGLLKYKIAESILLTRADITHEPDFLGCFGKSPQTLAMLIKALSSGSWESDQKRRKKNQAKRVALWSDVSGAPAWSTAGA